MNEEKKDSVTAASLKLLYLLIGFQSLEWYTGFRSWMPKLVPFGAVIPIFGWAHQVDPLVVPPPPEEDEDVIARAKVVQFWTSARHAGQDVLTTGYLKITEIPRNQDVISSFEFLNSIRQFM